MKFNRLALSALLCVWGFQAQAQYNPDTATILGNLHGCFEVTYNFVEDGPHDKSYAPIYEWIRTDHREGMLVFEHIGQYPIRNEDGSPVLDESGNPTYFSQYHWREEWRRLSAQRWEQVVIGPFNDPRYECVGRFMVNQFACTAQRATKPRRDRNRDYSHLVRDNRVQINPERWVHSQSNFKMSESNELVSSELGWNTYKRVDQSICQQSIDAHPMPIEREYE